ncbi:MAG: YhcH/YjgK/YiaL family protein [Bacteroidales bacterium]|nr:YhcH/YjgK/YiaL family protein [Bacteroidales bacterium]
MEGYDCERDIIFFNDLNKSDRHIADSTVMFIFFPSDLHKPSVAIDHPAPVRKVVVKIPMRCFSCTDFSFHSRFPFREHH